MPVNLKKNRASGRSFKNLVLVLHKSRKFIAKMKQKGLKKWRAPLAWAGLILLYGYWQLIPEVSLVNATGQIITHIEVKLLDDDKVYREIAPGANKTFRYHPSSTGGSYDIRVIMSDGSILKETVPIIKSWNLGHKVVFEFLPDGSVRVDLSYSLFDNA